MSTENRIIEASSLFKEKVVGQNNKKLGNIVNIIFDRKYFVARMLIFPDEETKSFIKKLLESGKEISSDVIKDLSLPFDDKTDEILKNMMDKGRKEAFKIARDYLTEMEDRLKKIYYLVLVTELDRIKKAPITLKNASKLYEKESCNMGTTDNDLAFYEENAIPEVKSLWPITLNLVKLRGEMVNDPEDRPGMIINLQLDLDAAIVNNFIIQTIGKGACKRLVDPKQIDFSTLSTKSKFEDYPPIN